MIFLLKKYLQSILKNAREKWIVRFNASLKYLITMMGSITYMRDLNNFHFYRYRKFYFIVRKNYVYFY